MRRFLVTSALAALGLLATVAPAAAAPGKYVALGDSYSSGLGAGSYGDSGSCKRSTNAYAQLWANAKAPSSFTFAACSGARTADVLSGQVAAVTRDTALVTISIGGNDAGFATVMTDCNTGSDDTCVAKNKAAQDFARTTLPARLDGVYDKIRANAPQAKVVVMGYPLIYKLGGSCIVGLSEKKRAAINDSSNVLAEVTSARANAHGFTFVDGRTAFTGHEICASGERWINSVSIPVDESYHANAPGHKGGYYAALVKVTG